MSILPSYIVEAFQNKIPAPEKKIPKEYGIDFETKTLTGGIVKGKEAIRVWIWLALQVERYRYGIYSWQYGAELEEYIGSSYSQEYLNDGIRMTIEDCLKMNPYIQSISEFHCQIEGNRLALSLTVNTDYGEVSLKV